MTTPPRQDGDRLTIECLIDQLVSNDPHALLCIPAHGSLGRWLQLHEQNTTAWQKRQLAQIIDPAAQGFATQGHSLLHQRAALALRFYGYPHAQTPAQRGALIDALRQRLGFADAALKHTFMRVHEDLKTLADQLQALISGLDLDQTPFQRQHLDRTRCRLTSGSYWDASLRNGAQRLQTLLEHAHFLSLEHARELADDECVFDPQSGSLRGTRHEIRHVQLLTLPVDAGVDALTQLSRQLNLAIDKHGELSLTQLLGLHGLPLPDKRDGVWDLIEQLHRAEPLRVPPVCDLANADIALLEYANAHHGTFALKPRWSNYWQCLEPGVLALSAEQRGKVLGVVSAFVPKSGERLLDVLWPASPSDHPDDILHHLLDSHLAQTLADRLINAVGWYGHAPGETAAAPHAMPCCWAQ
ncbi:hypothetical protein JWR97_02120 [Pseudomonas cedrina subsp. fulgida]|nr:hypothetical protein [Pseudomonas cedrina subsp. fulgida]